MQSRMMVSHSGKAGVWFSFRTGHFGFSRSEPSMVQESMSKAASSQRKHNDFFHVHSTEKQ